MSGFREMVEDMEACHAIVHGVAKLDTAEQLNNSNIACKFSFLSYLILFGHSHIFLNEPGSSILFIFQKDSNQFDDLCLLFLSLFYLFPL